MTDRPTAPDAGNLDRADLERAELDRAEFDRLTYRLLGVAYRMLGSWADAEDVVAETWLRWHDRRPAELDEPVAWLTTVTTRLALDRWRTLARRREEYIGPWLPEPIDPARLPHETIEQRQTLAFGLLHLMDRLGPEERAVYVLRYAFDHPFPEIARMLGRTPASCRQLAHRARAKIDVDPNDVQSGRESPMLEALLGAVAAGRAAEAVSLLTEDAVLLNDSDGKVAAARRPIEGPEKIYRFLLGILRRAGDAQVQMMPVNAGIGVLYTVDGIARLGMVEVRGDRIHRLHTVANPEKLAGLAGITGPTTAPPE